MKPLWLLGLLVLCARAPAATVVDDMGHPLDTLPHARRIITLAPSDTELVLAAGAGSRLVAASSAGTPLPAGVQKLYVFGGLDRERLLQLNPDLVIAWASGNRASDLAWLRSLGIRVYETEPRKVSDIARELRDIGELAGTEAAADRAARAFNRALRHACTRSGPPRRVYVDIWDRPALTVGGQHWLNDVLAHADLRNIYRRIDRGVFPIEAEARMAQPAAGIVHLDRHDRLARLLGRPGPRLPQAIASLCKSTPTRAR